MAFTRFYPRWIMPLALWLACYGAAAAPQQLSYQVLQEAPHDSRLFTQGLILQDGALVETSGGYGHSLIRRYDAGNGAVIQQLPLPPKVFAEGVAQVGDDLLVLTWRENVAFRLDAKTLAPKAQHEYKGEGWGLTYDGEHLIMSDGSNTLTRRDPVDFTPVSTLPVTGGADGWENLNELEYAEGLIWANIWQDSRIIAIDPKTGQVAGVLDLADLVELNSTRPAHSVLNGIAYDPEQRAFWVTGKLWPRRYLLKIVWPDNEDSGNPGK